MGRMNTHPAGPRGSALHPSHRPRCLSIKTGDGLEWARRFGGRCRPSRLRPEAGAGLE